MTGPLSSSPVPSPAVPDGLEHVAANVAHWQSRRETELALARRMWSSAEPTWGVYSVPESHVGMLPVALEGKRTVELGCGTGYVSAWLARRGAVPFAIDPTPGQLAITAAMQAEHNLRFPLVRAVGEQVPFRDGAFDVAISEYGAAIWADPHRWIPEAARLLRPGGELVFLGNSTLLTLCMPDEDDAVAGDRLVRPQHDMHRFEWSDATVEFHLSPGGWIRLLRANGFDVEDLIEVRPPAGATSTYEGALVTKEWVQRWPPEEVWRARKR